MNPNIYRAENGLWATSVELVQFDPELTSPMSDLAARIRSGNLERQLCLTRPDKHQDLEVIVASGASDSGCTLSKSMSTRFVRTVLGAG